MMEFRLIPPSSTVSVSEPRGSKLITINYYGKRS